MVLDTGTMLWHGVDPQERTIVLVNPDSEGPLVLLSSAADSAARPTPLTSAASPRRIAVVRAVAALLWAAAFAIAVGDGVPSTGSDVPAVAVALLVLYPLIDVIASLVDARRANAAISLLASVALAVATVGADAGAALVVFGAWAAVSGAIQLAVAVAHRRAGGRELPMIVSGGLSTLAGLSFVAASSADDAHLANLAGYAAFGAVLYLVWAMRRRATA